MQLPHTTSSDTKFFLSGIFHDIDLDCGFCRQQSAREGSQEQEDRHSPVYQAEEMAGNMHHSQEEGLERAERRHSEWRKDRTTGVNCAWELCCGQRGRNTTAL